MAKNKNSKKPPTKPYPTGSGSSHSVLKQPTPEIPLAVYSEIRTKQADLSLSSAPPGPISPSEPSMPASVAIAASTPKLNETLTSATVASAPQASVPEQTNNPSPSIQMGLIEKVQPPTATLNGPSGKSLPATSSSTDLDPASKWRRFRQSQKQIYRRKEVEAPAISPHLAVPIDSPQDAVVENPSLLISENRLPASQTIKEGQPQLKPTFAEISATPARKSDLNSQISLPIRSPMPIISTSKAVTDTPSSSTVAFDYDVSKGGLIVDLSPHFVPSSAAPSEDESYSSQQGFSTPESLSEGEDNPDDENDQFIQDSVGVFGDPGISDHSPCCIYMDSFSPKQKKPFKFFSMLNSHPEFAEVLHQCWNSLPFSGSRMFLVSKKLKEIKSIIRAFSKENFSEIEKRVAESFSELQSCQHALLASPSPSLAALERTAHRKWIMLAKAEESFLRQRARIQWLAEGDCNSAFFYRAIKSRSAQNFIHMLLDSSDRVIDDLQGIKDHILGFYQNLLGGQIQPTSSSPDLIGDLVPYRCSSEASATLLARLSDPDDEYYWCVNDVELDKFSTKHTWEFLRPRGPVQDWTATVWFKGSVPRHAFHFWVTQLDRLPTRTRLASWGLPIDQSCCLCGNALENRDHLFLRCEVSQYLWSMITRRLGFRTFTFHTWTAFIAWLGSNHSSHSTTLRRIAAQATIYILWYERNNRLHNSISSSPAVLFKLLDRLIKDTILARRNMKSFNGLLRRWLAFS
ncbi:BnaA04g05510D [Brassica napus]|uniref:BnaA04g05510D protein n=1 Tax=Brassica napus TaxID=3708 RepID=A0A078GF07_BRANA|nr:BnaA04g05510D [Brassica napus]